MVLRLHACGLLAGYIIDSRRHIFIAVYIPFTYEILPVQMSTVSHDSLVFSLLLCEDAMEKAPENANVCISAPCFKVRMCLCDFSFSQGKYFSFLFGCD